MIEIRNLKKKYGGTTVLSITELQIGAGKCFGLVGNNGAGKTTLFNLILDLIRATEGEVLSKNRKVSDSEHWKGYTGSYLDESFLIGFLSPSEYFSFIGNIHGLNKEDIELFLEQHRDFLDQDTARTKKLIRDLSSGNKSKVGILATMLGRPEVIVLDEPFSHLDPSSQIRLKRILRSFVENGTTVLISSHDLKHVSEISDRIVILDKGEIIKDLQTTPETLKELEDYFMV